MCHMSCVMCQMSSVTCHLSSATVTDPTPANSPTVHSRQVCKDRKTPKKFKTKKNHLIILKIKPGGGVSSRKPHTPKEGHGNS